jgi:hypothetical protein
MIEMGRSVTRRSRPSTLIMRSVGVVLLAVALAGCGGSKAKAPTAAERRASAQTAFYDENTKGKGYTEDTTQPSPVFVDSPHSMIYGFDCDLIATLTREGGKYGPSRNLDGTVHVGYGSVCGSH